MAFFNSKRASSAFSWLFKAVVAIIVSFSSLAYHHCRCDGVSILRRSSNEGLLKLLSDAETRQQLLGDNSPHVETMLPRFDAQKDELKWKLNKAKKTLNKARQFELMAKKAAVQSGKYAAEQQKHSVVTDIIKNTERTLLDAGDKLGFDYEKF